MPLALINTTCPRCKKAMNKTGEEQPQQMDSKDVEKWKQCATCPLCGGAVVSDCGYSIVYFRPRK